MSFDEMPLTVGARGLRRKADCRELLLRSTNTGHVNVQIAELEMLLAGLTKLRWPRRKAPITEALHEKAGPSAGIGIGSTHGSAAPSRQACARAGSVIELGPCTAAPLTVYWLPGLAFRLDLRLPCQRVTPTTPTISSTAPPTPRTMRPTSECVFESLLGAFAACEGVTTTADVDVKPLADAA